MCILDLRLVLCLIFILLMLIVIFTIANINMRQESSGLKDGGKEKDFIRND